MTVGNGKDDSATTLTQSDCSGGAGSDGAAVLRSQLDHIEAQKARHAALMQYEARKQLVIQHYKAELDRAIEAYITARQEYDFQKEAEACRWIVRSETRLTMLGVYDQQPNQ